jgi:uncharacterized protein (DUF427 family)
VASEGHIKGEKRVLQQTTKTTLIVRERANGDVVASGTPGEKVQEFEGHWYFKRESVDMTHLHITERIYTCPYKGRCYWIDLESPHGRAQNVAWTYFDVKPGYEFIEGQIAFYARNTAGTISERQG